MSCVNSHNEWDPLEEVVVGIVESATIPQKDRGQIAIEFPGCDPSSLPESGAFPRKVIEETREDLEGLAEKLQKLGIRVKRPEGVNHSKMFGTPDWQTNGFYNYCPRDPVLVVGNKIIEAPMTLRCRYHEPLAYKEIFLEYFANGADWISAPKPKLLDAAYNLEDPDKPLNNVEPIFDAANVLRAGEDLFYLISSTGNELGCQWLQRTLGDRYRVHPCYDLYNSIHIDSTLAFLRPGLVLLNPERVTDSNLPTPLRAWDKIWCPDMVDTGFTGSHAYSSVWVGMNLLMLNPNLALVDSAQIELIKELERYDIETLPHQLRHSRTLGGGFHCVTLDTVRKGRLENYF